MRLLFIILLFVTSVYVHATGNVFSDMILDPTLIRTSKHTKSSGILAYQSVPWPAGILAIQFDSSFTRTEKRVFLNVCELWSQVANVRCVERSDEVNYIRIDGNTNGRCSSTVGMPTGGIGIMTLPPECRSEYMILHELGHAFGLAHEHQRPDRDQYVTVDNSLLDNPDHMILSNIDVSHPYDFRSVMHYPLNQGIVALPQFRQYTAALVPLIGYSVEPSPGDSASMRALYGNPVPFTPQEAFGEISSISQDCTQGTSCSVTVKWRAYNTNSAGVIIQNTQSTNDYRICEGSPCTITVSVGEYNFSLKKIISSSDSDILDSKTRTLIAYLSDIKTNLSVNGVEYNESFVGIPLVRARINDLIRIAWSARDELNRLPSPLANVRAKVSYSVDQESCGTTGSGPHLIPEFNDNNQFEGSYQFIAHDCQLGRTYTFVYRLEDEHGNTISSTTVRVKIIESRDVVLTANGKTDSITVSPGQTVNYNWMTSQDYISGSAEFTVIQDEPGCGTPSSGPYIWPSITDQNFRSGTTSATVLECQVGRSYIIKFSARKANGVEKSTQIRVNVRSN